MKLLDNVQPFGAAEAAQSQVLGQEDAMWRDSGYVWWRSPYRTPDELLTLEQLREALWHAQVQGFLVMRMRFIDGLLKHRNRAFAARYCFGMLCRMAGVMSLNHEFIDMLIIKGSKENNAKMLGILDELRAAYEAEFGRSHPALVENLRFLLG